MELYKRNAQGRPIFWNVNKIDENTIEVKYGIVGQNIRTEHIRTQRNVSKEINSLITSKRKEGYKELKDLYDNAPDIIDNNLYNYLNTYLPKYNTHEDGKFIPMLCKTLTNENPFKKGQYFGQWKINGERCIITAEREKGLFETVKLHYRSREGVDWTGKLSYLDDYLLPYITSNILDMMVEEGAALDGELYIPGYGINEINSFIKNIEIPQHYQLQFWLYDLCIDNMTAYIRQEVLSREFNSRKAYYHIGDKESHYNNKERLILLDNYTVFSFDDAIKRRDEFINLGFEGLVIREQLTDYQFGGKRNNAMLKFKKIQDGWFEILDIVPEGTKRSNLPKFVLRNDINSETFTCTLNAPHSVQEDIFAHKTQYIGNLMLVEYRERSGIAQTPFHHKGIKIKVARNTDYDKL